MAERFKLTGEMEGKTLTINDRYAFVEGELIVDKDTADKIGTILEPYYGCIRETVKEEVVIKPSGDDTSLKTTETKGAKQVDPK